MVWALTADVYSDGRTLLEENEEPLVRILVALPLVVSAAAWFALRQSRTRGGRTGRRIGLISAAFMWVVAGTTGFTVGNALLPTAAALLIAAVVTPTHGGPNRTA